MPTTWWGRLIMWGYIAGYWVYVLAAAVWAWPQMTFFTWWTYLGFQMVYAVFWPVLLLLATTGFRW